MPGWLIWAVAIWFVYTIVSRRGCGWGGPRLHRIRNADRSRIRGRSRPEQLRSSRSRTSRSQGPRSRASRSSTRSSRPKETAEERIRRRFVEGRIDLDRYEAELWEELRPK